MTETSIQFLVKDPVRPEKRPLAMLARESGPGVQLMVKKRDGTVLGSVILDYHDNTLTAVVTGKNSDDALASYILSEDVDTDRKTRIANSIKEIEKRTWFNQFGKEYTVPPEILNDPELEDCSWGNEAAPSFVVKGNRDPDGVNLILWSDHPDQSRRECVEHSRFSVSDLNKDEDGDLYEGTT